MSKHEHRLEQKSSAKPDNTKGRGALDDNDLDRATGGLTLSYSHIQFEYTPQNRAD